MEDSEILQIIANVGFAGAVAIILLQMVKTILYKKLDQLTQAIIDLREAIYDLKEVIIEYLIGDKRESKR